MFIKQMYTNCLAHAAYYIESAGQAAVIDPLRNPEPYIQLAKERGATIKYVLETHFHADFVSGHIDLANATGATIVFGPRAEAGYKVYVAEDGEKLVIGDVELEVVHTPGHTIESTSFLLYDEEGHPNAIFTGDSLFVGDVGRPDLLSGNLAKEELAEFMYDSLQNKIKNLPDEVVVYPGHGAGSACGKNIGSESFSTIGDEKKHNYALTITDKTEFIAAVTSDLPSIPGYFFMDAKANKTGYDSFEMILQRNCRSIKIDDFVNLQKGGALVLDTRNPEEFANGFVPGALNIGLNGDFAVWAGNLISPDATLLLVTDPGKEKETVERLSRIGYDKVHGYLEGGMQTWLVEHMDYGYIMVFDGKDVGSLLETGEYNLLDVRNRKEVAKHRLAGSVHIPLNQLADRISELPKNEKWLIYCAGGYRSMIAASFLKVKGFHFVASVEGGINEVFKRAPQLLAADEDN